MTNLILSNTNRSLEYIKILNYIYNNIDNIKIIRKNNIDLMKDFSWKKQ